jgi:hypothetical protein
MFKIGQKVVCIKTHSQGVVLKDRIYTINNILESECCGKILVDVGAKMNKYEKLLCISCGTLIPNNGIHWIACKLFSPLENDFAENVLKKAIQQINEELVPIFN